MNEKLVLKESIKKEDNETRVVENGNQEELNEFRNNLNAIEEQIQIIKNDIENNKNNGENNHIFLRFSNFINELIGDNIDFFIIDKKEDEPINSLMKLENLKKI